MSRISCPDCGTSYKLPEGAIPEGGRPVQCRRCGAAWIAGAEDAAQASEAEPEPEPEPEQTGEPSFEAPTLRRALVPVAGDLATPLGQRPVIDATAERFRGRAGGEARRRRRLPRGGHQRMLASPRAAAAGTVALLLLVLGGFAFREPIVRALPDLAGLYALMGAEVNLRGLQFADIRTFREQEESTPVLVVEGSIHNVSDREQPVPALRFGLTGDTPRELYAWSMQPERVALGPGEEVAFSSRLPVPPESAARINVRFIDRPTAGAGP